jgi:hypothetical protein
MKFRKKPVVIEAIRYRTIRHEVDAFCPGLIWDVEDYSEIPYIQTLEGRMRINKGDWIIKGVKGEFYPCKPDIFELTYESIQVDQKTQQGRLLDAPAKEESGAKESPQVEVQQDVRGVEASQADAVRSEGLGLLQRGRVHDSAGEQEAPEGGSEVGDSSRAQASREVTSKVYLKNGMRILAVTCSKCGNEEAVGDVEDWQGQIGKLVLPELQGGGVSAPLPTLREDQARTEVTQTVLTKEDRGIFIPREELEKAHAKLDLGESTFVALYLYPRRDMLHELVRFTSVDSQAPTTVHTVGCYIDKADYQCCAPKCPTRGVSPAGLQLKETQKLLDWIASACGTPDAAEGCRNILKRIRELKESTAPYVSPAVARNVDGGECPEGECYANAYFEGAGEWEERARVAEETLKEAEATFHMIANNCTTDAQVLKNLAEWALKLRGFCTRPDKQGSEDV